MPNKMLFSIIIPLFNREQLIIETLESLIRQTYKYWEAIIVDDGSTDNSQAVVEEFTSKDARIKLYLRDIQPKGAPTCRNIGITKAKGNYIIFLDSDDLLKPFALHQRYEIIKDNSDLDYWVFQTVNFEDSPKNEKNKWNKLSDEDNISRFLSLDSVWHTSGPTWKTETVKKHLNFDKKLLCWQDVDFHIQALLKNLTYKVFFQLPPDVLYRRHSADSISQGGFSQEKRKSQLYFIQKYYQEVKSEKHKTILQKIYKSLLKNNFKSRYYSNIFAMFCWKILKR